jgi:hypothetical protein
VELVRIDTRLAEKLPKALVVLRVSLRDQRQLFHGEMVAGAPCRMRRDPRLLLAVGHMSRTNATGDVTLPHEFDPRRLVRRALELGLAVLLLVLIVILAPGLGDVRRLLADADPRWIALGVALEALSCVSYVLMFRPIFCPHMSLRTSWEIGLSELAVGSLVPASGAGGLALGAWVLHEGGMPGEKIARR